MSKTLTSCTADITLMVQSVLSDAHHHVYRPQVVDMVLDLIEEREEITLSALVRAVARQGVYYTVAALMDKEIKLKGTVFKKFLGIATAEGTEKLYIPIEYAKKHDFEKWLSQEDKRNKDTQRVWRKRSAVYRKLLDGPLAKARSNNRIFPYLCA